VSCLIFDIETNGLLDELDTIHSLVIKDADAETNVWSYCRDPSYAGRSGSIEEGLARLATADVIAGHNVISFDIPAIQKVYPEWRPRGAVRDTIILTRLLWPKEAVETIDFARQKRGLHPSKLIGSYSLEAWGYRLGNYKGDFKGPWDTWTAEMQSYCEQDVEVTTKLWRRCQDELMDVAALKAGRKPEPWGAECVELEHEVATIVARQERYGFCFDLEKAAKLYAVLAARRTELEQKLQLMFPPKTIETVFVPRVNNKKIGYVKGVPFTKRKVVPFNPGSRKQVAARLQELGWKPKEFTADGTPKVDDDILSALPHPAAKVLAEFYVVAKRLGALAEGKEAWLKLERKGRIHGRVTTNGAVTGRMTHSKPNGANVPGVGAEYGRECRELFRASPGKKLVGCDADALELRCLAHFMAQYDGGEYVQTVLLGKKEEGTDMHSVNARALGCDRDVAKVWFYAFIYGAGDWKLGYTLLGKGSKAKLIAAGKSKRASFLSGLPAMGKLVGAVQRILKGYRRKDGAIVPGRNWLRGLDGRRVYIRSEHAALNTLLQSAGALIMKRALVILDNNLQAAGLVPGKDYEFVANVHDEWQIDTDPAHVETVGKLAAESIRLAGEHFKFLCPLKGNYSVGDTWADTH